jgi:hypothetical protein
MHDTSPEAAAIARRAVRRRLPAQRMRDALELSETLRALALSRLRKLHPDDPPIALVERLMGEPLQAMPLGDFPRLTDARIRLGLRRSSARSSSPAEPRAGL